MHICRFFLLLEGSFGESVDCTVFIKYYLCFKIILYNFL